jgi:hypothetical protein
MKKKIVFLWGTIAFSAFLVLALFWYRERVVMFDVAFHLFAMLKEGTFAIQSYRFGAAFTQAFPLAAAAFGADIKYVAALYSASFVVLPAAVFYVLLTRLQNPRMALVGLLSTVALTTHTFFWVQSELIQTIAFCMLFGGVLERALQKERASAGILLALGLLPVVICFLHPLSAFPFFYLLLFFGLRYSSRWRFVGGIAAAYLLTWILKNLFFRNGYDVQAMGGLRNILTHFPNYLDLQSNRDLLNYLLHDYYVVAILLLLLVAFYIRHRAWKSLGLLLFFFLGFTALINISYADGTDPFYIESDYLLLGVFVALPAVYDLFPRFLHKSLYAHLFLGAIVCSCIARIWGVHPFYARRLSWYQNVLEQTAPLANRKIILPSEVAPTGILLLTWGSSYEFWLLSTLNGGSARSLIVEERAGEYDASLERNKAFITKWGALDYTDLKGPYFPFTDTSAYVKWPVGKPLPAIP